MRRAGTERADQHLDVEVRFAVKVASVCPSDIQSSPGLGGQCKYSGVKSSTNFDSILSPPDLASGSTPAVPTDLCAVSAVALCRYCWEDESRNFLDWGYGNADSRRGCRILYICKCNGEAARGAHTPASTLPSSLRSPGESIAMGDSGRGGGPNSDSAGASAGNVQMTGAATIIELGHESKTSHLRARITAEGIQVVDSASGRSPQISTDNG
ncbi:hypothetical protein H4582DRAFT_2061566 [Lactarius indigo]|nr:hypothetical protein H4582DRAFT_2061566 [Lactarius indigo]